jgi:hypothetical protein
MMNRSIVLLTTYYHDEQIKLNEMSRTCVTQAGKKQKILVGKCKKKEIHLKDLGIGEGILLIWDFKNVVRRCGLYSTG